MEGHFRQDLFFRINVINITVPPLRDRKEQILPLSQYYLNFYQNKYGKDVPSFSPKVIHAFNEYAWPGNIRELENMIKRVVLFGEEDPTLKNLSGKTVDDGINSESSNNLSTGGPAEKKALNLKDLGKRAAEDAEKEVIQNTLLETHWNRKRAAKLLRVSYKSLLYKIHKYHLDGLKGYRRIEEKVG
jgi:two-component system response regulator AtoC